MTELLVSVTSKSQTFCKLPIRMFTLEFDSPLIIIVIITCFNDTTAMFDPSILSTWTCLIFLCQCLISVKFLF